MSCRSKLRALTVKASYLEAFFRMEILGCWNISAYYVLFLISFLVWSKNIERICASF